MNPSTTLITEATKQLAEIIGIPSSAIDRLRSLAASRDERRLLRLWSGIANRTIDPSEIEDLVNDEILRLGREQVIESLSHILRVTVNAECEAIIPALARLYHQHAMGDAAPAQDWFYSEALELLRNLTAREFGDLRVILRGASRIESEDSIEVYAEARRDGSVELRAVRVTGEVRHGFGEPIGPTEDVQRLFRRLQHGLADRGDAIHYRGAVKFKASVISHLCSICFSPEELAEDTEAA